LIIVVFRRATQNWRELLPEGIHDAHGPGAFLDPRQFQHGCSDDFPVESVRPQPPAICAQDHSADAKILEKCRLKIDGRQRSDRLHALFDIIGIVALGSARAMTQIFGGVRISSWLGGID
jgi:hypothetical protein